MDPKMKLVGLAVAAAAALIVANWDKIKEFWETKLKPAFEALKEFVVNTVVPKVKAAWEDLKAKITEIFGKIKEVWEKKLKPAFEALKTFVTTTVVPKVKAAWGELQTKIDNVFGAIKELWEKVLKPLLDTMKRDFVDNILPVIIEAWETLGTTFESVFNGISRFWNQYGEAIVQAVVDFFSDGAGRVIDMLKDLINFITGVFTGDWKKAWEALIDLVKKPFEGLGQILKKPINAVIELINKMLGKVESGLNSLINGINNKLRLHFEGVYIGWPINKQVAAFDWSPNLKTVNFGRIKALYKGGVLGEGERAMVGEYAPEYLTVRNGQAIVTPMPGADRFGNTNNEITVNIYTQPGQSARDIAREAIDIMTREQRQRSAAYA
jgi:phage-related protein